MHVPCPRCGKAGAARGRHDGHVRRLVVVLPALRRPAQRRRRRSTARVVDYWLPVVAVHRRHRPPDRAPALLALLRQGDERHGAWSASASRSRACSTRAGCSWAARRCRRREGNVTGPDALVEAYGADAVRLYILFMGPADQDMEWTPTRASRASSRFLRRLWRVVHEVAEARAGATARRRRADAEGARDDRRGHRRHRAALPVPHADLGGDGAGQRAVGRPDGAGRALRGRDGGQPDPALRAARRRGAVAAAGARAPVGAAVARGRSRATWSATRSSSSCRSTARCATGSRSTPALPERRAGRAWRCSRSRCGRTWTASRSGRRSSSPASSSTSSSVSG